MNITPYYSSVDMYIFSTLGIYFKIKTSDMYIIYIPSHVGIIEGND